MLEEDTQVRFQTTRWSVLEAMALGGEEGERARAQLAETYWPAIYAYLRRSGRGRDEAGEITQSFFGDVVYGRGLFESADPERGRLRTLLLKSLRHYLVDLHRRAQSRGAGFRVGPEAIERVEATMDRDPDISAEVSFERAWARASLSEAIRRCEAHFQSIGKSGHWQAFETRILRPSTMAVVSPAYEEFFQDCGFRSLGDARAAVQTVKRRLTAFLEEVAAEAAEGGAGELTRALLGA